MMKTQIALTGSLESAHYHLEPFPHATVDGFAPNVLFARLARTWPSDALYPVPAERSLANPRRLHAWLKKDTSIQIASSDWLDLIQALHSSTFLDAMQNVSERLGLPINKKSKCILRLCQEALPYDLPKHRDGTEKALSLVWYVDGGLDGELGTTLYGNKDSKYVKSVGNSALFIPNLPDSFHGGYWKRSNGYFRKTVHVFLVEDDAVS